MKASYIFLPEWVRCIAVLYQIVIHYIMLESNESVNIGSRLMYNHITWIGDAFVVELSKQKGDQGGKTCVRES